MSKSRVKFIVIGGAIFGLVLVAAWRFFSGSGKAAGGRGIIEGTVIEKLSDIRYPIEDQTCYFTV